MSNVSPSLSNLKFNTADGSNTQIKITVIPFKTVMTIREKTYYKTSPQDYMSECGKEILIYFRLLIALSSFNERKAVYIIKLMLDLKITLENYKLNCLAKVM